MYGLVLAGGRSRRMGRDKATLEYAGETQLARAMRLLAHLVEHTFVSVRPDQRDDPERAGYDLIVDRVADRGPMEGIQAELEREGVELEADTAPTTEYDEWREAETEQPELLRGSRLDIS